MNFMISLFNTWQFNLVMHLIFVVTYFQFYKLAVNKAKHDGAATILLQLICSAAAVVMIPLFPMQLPSDQKVYWLLAGACIFYAISDRLATTARKHLEVSAFSVINQLTTVILIVYGFILFQEPLVQSKIIGAALILGGNILLRYAKGAFHMNKYIWIAVAGSAALATALSIDINNARLFNLPLYITFTFFVPALMLMIVERMSVQRVFHEFEIGNKRYYLIAGIAWTLTTFFLLRAYQFGATTIIAPLAATSVLLNVLVAYVFLGERRDQLKKILSAVLVIIGILLTVQ